MPVVTLESWPFSCDLPLTRTGGGWHGQRALRADYEAEVLMEPRASEWTLWVRITRGQTPWFEGCMAASAFPHGGIHRHHFGVLPEEPALRAPAGDLSVFLDSEGTIKGQFANSVSGLSYMPVLRRIIDELQPVDVLEWGPGRSTLMLAEALPRARIQGIEHNPRWVERCRLIADRHPNVEIIHEPLTLKPATSGKYVTAPLYSGQKYDLIFVDGRLRCDCLAIARQVIKPNGIVLLHDAHRKNYRPAFALYRSVRVENNTAILRP